MNGSLIQLLVLAGIAIFLILKLRSVLGTRAPGIQQESIGISGLASGLYNVRITDGLGGQGIKRMVVQ